MAGRYQMHVLWHHGAREHYQVLRIRQFPDRPTHFQGLAAREHGRRKLQLVFGSQSPVAIMRLGCQALSNRYFRRRAKHLVQSLAADKGRPRPAGSFGSQKP